MAREMVKGGPTEAAMNAGGETLFIELQMIMGGHTAEAVVYALARSGAALGLQFNDLGKASSLIRQMAKDSISELELNWSDRERLLRDSRAHIHRQGGHA